MKLVSLEDTQRQILSGAKDAFVLIDAAKKFLAANQPFTRLSGYRASDLAGKDITHLFAPKDRAEFGKWLSCVWSMGQKKSAFSMLKKNGTRLKVELSRWPIRHKGKSAVLLIFRSLLKEEELARKLSRSEDRYQERARELKIINEIGRAVNSAVDLKTLLSALATEIVAAVPCHYIGLAFPDPLGTGYSVLVAETEGEGEGTGLITMNVGESPGIQRVAEELEHSRWGPRAGDPALKPHFSKYGIKNGEFFPIISDGVCLAVLLVLSKSAKKLAKRQRQFVTDISLHLAVAIKNATYLNNLTVTNSELVKTKKLLEDQKRKLEQLSNQDGLTGLVNQRYFKAQLEEEMTRAERYGTPLSLMILDIDFFKQFNDQNGHFLGDEALKAVARLIEETVREVDIAARYGGDEFAVILPHTGLEEAELVARRLLEASARHRFETKDGSQAPVTLSIGVAVHPEHGRTYKELVESADRAMYEAKERGRDQVLTSTGDREAGWVAAGAGASEESMRLQELIDVIAERLESSETWPQQVYYATAIARGLKLGEREIETVRRCVPLQDIGKVGLADAVVKSTSALSGEQQEWVSKHPELGANIIRSIIRSPASIYARMIPVIEQHHECFDGSGFPKGLEGEEIAVEARILSVARALARLTLEEGLSIEKGVARIEKEAGKKYDPQVVVAIKSFLTVYAT